MGANCPHTSMGMTAAAPKDTQRRPLSLVISVTLILQFIALKRYYVVIAGAPCPPGQGWRKGGNPV